MIVAGIGCRKGVSVEDVLAAFKAALDSHGLAATAVSSLATTEFKRNEPAIFAAADALGLPVVVVDNDDVDASTRYPAELPRSLSSGTPAPRPGRSAGASAAGNDRNAGDNRDAALTPPSPLWGGIEGGGANALRSAAVTISDNRIQLQPAVPPPPSIPPHKGEGVVSAALGLIFNSPDGENGRADSDKRVAKATTGSAFSLALAGTPSVSEAAALAAAGAGARLLGPRTVTGPVTCAIAIGGEPA